MLVSRTDSLLSLIDGQMTYIAGSLYSYVSAVVLGIEIYKHSRSSKIEHRIPLLSSETNDMNTGLLVEVWCKGFLWDRFLGYYYVPLSEVSYMNEVTSKQSYNTSSTVSTGKQEQQHVSSDSTRDTNSNTQPPDITSTVH